MKKSNRITKGSSYDDWEARDDANTLARAAEIQADKKRLAKAAQAAKTMVDDASARARAMKRIAKKAPTQAKKPAKKARK